MRVAQIFKLFYAIQLFSTIIFRINLIRIFKFIFELNILRIRAILWVNLNDFLLKSSCYIRLKHYMQELHCKYGHSIERSEFYETNLIFQLILYDVICFDVIWCMAHFVKTSFNCDSLHLFPFSNLDSLSQKCDKKRTPLFSKYSFSVKFEGMFIWGPIYQLSRISRFIGATSLCCLWK